MTKEDRSELGCWSWVVLIFVGFAAWPYIFLSPEKRMVRDFLSVAQQMEGTHNTLRNLAEDNAEDQTADTGDFEHHFALLFRQYQNIPEFRKQYESYERHRREIVANEGAVKELKRTGKWPPKIYW